MGFTSKVHKQDSNVALEPTGESAARFGRRLSSALGGSGACATLGAIMLGGQD
jgi:hypothetical protein